MAHGLYNALAQNPQLPKARARPRSTTSSLAASFLEVPSMFGGAAVAFTPRKPHGTLHLPRSRAGFILADELVRCPPSWSESTSAVCCAGGCSTFFSSLQPLPKVRGILIEQVACEAAHDFLGCLAQPKHGVALILFGYALGGIGPAGSN
jgi:hypothetical protein